MERLCHREIRNRGRTAPLPVAWTVSKKSNARELAGAAEFPPNCEGAEPEKHEAAWFGRGSCACDVAVLGEHGYGIRSAINKCDAG